MDIQRTNGAYGGGNATGMVGGSEESVGRRGRTGAAPAMTRGDTVSVSQDGHLLSVARGVAQNTPDTRAEKVARLREQVESGAYVPNSRRIAEALVREEPGLFRIV